MAKENNQDTFEQKRSMFGSSKSKTANGHFDYFRIKQVKSRERERIACLYIGFVSFEKGKKKFEKEFEIE